MSTTEEPASDLESASEPTPTPTMETWDRAMRALRSIDREMAEVNRRAAAEQNFIREWVAAELEPLRDSSDRLRESIAQMTAALVRGRKLKTLTGPYGRASVRDTDSPVWDDELALKWCENNAPEFIVPESTKPVPARVDKVKLKEHAIGASDGTAVLSDGTIIEGLVFEHHRTFSVEPYVDEETI